MDIFSTHYHAYGSWLAMLHRCYDKNRNNFKRYGRRGITVCDRWRYSFANFLEDMGERPHGTSLDRIDNSKGYCKENCRWANMKEQQNNRRNNRLIEAFGEKLTLTNWARKTGINVGTIWKRLKLGMSPEKALGSKENLSARYVNAFGERKTIAEWSRLYGIRANRILRRLNSGWKPEKAIKTEIGKPKNENNR